MCSRVIDSSGANSYVPAFVHKHIYLSKLLLDFRKESMDLLGFRNVSLNGNGLAALRTAFCHAGGRGFEDYCEFPRIIALRRWWRLLANPPIRGSGSLGTARSGPEDD
jgi:hypothetical protein